MLVDLMVLLDGTGAQSDIANIQRELEAEEAESLASESDEEDDSDDDDDLESDELEGDGDDQGVPPKGIAKDLLIRKMIRDDRRQSREEALLRSLSRDRSSGSDALSADSIFRTASTTRQGAFSSSLRVQLSCEGKAGLAKPLVVSRAASIEEVVAAARSKFNVSRKFNLLYTSEEKAVVDAHGLALLPNETSLTLAAKAPAVSGVGKTEDASNSEVPMAAEPRAPKEPLADASGVKHGKRSMWSAIDLKKAERSSSNLDKSPRCDDSELSRLMKAELLRKMSSQTFLQRQEARSSLPIFAVKEELLRTITSNQVMLVSGATGSGEEIIVILKDCALSC